MEITQIMLDLETLGNSPNSVIISLGAVKFTNEITESYYALISPQSCVDVGLTMDVSTVIWWMNQSEKAREIFKISTLPIGDVLYDFTSWIGGEDPKKIEMWGCGSDFDNVILENAYQKCNLKVPWRYSGNRCYRTMKNLFPNVKMPEKDKLSVDHNALWDATNQALHLIEIQKYIRHLESLSSVNLPVDNP